MDESFLSDANVIRESRNFICKRLATYEDSAEAEYLRQVFSGRTGELDNTVFAMMNPDADEYLCKTGRSPNFAFRSPRAMADEMKLIAKKYQGKENLSLDELPVPQMKNFRLAQNVASCDGLPLIVAVLPAVQSKKENASEPKESSEAKNDSTELQNQPALSPSSVNQLAFDDSLAGKFHYYVTSDASELADVKDFSGEPGIYAIQPDAYGTSSVATLSWKPDSSLKSVADDLRQLADDSGKVTKNHNQHVRAGRQTGKEWQTEIPVTDPDAIEAQKRGR